MINALMAAGILAVAVLLGQGLKKKTAGDLIRALESGDQKQYRKCLMAFRTSLLLNSNTVLLMRANLSLMEGDEASACQCLMRIQPKKLSLEQKLNYYQAQISCSVLNQDEAAYQACLEGLRALKDGTQDAMIDELILQDEISRKLSGNVDRSVIAQLEELLKEREGAGQGMIWLSLARAYHLDHQEHRCTQALEEARRKLKGTDYEGAVEAAFSERT